MTWATAQRAVDFSLAEVITQARLRQRHPVTQLGYFGGEPLLEWELLKRSANYAQDQCDTHGILLKKTVTSNMTLLDDVRSSWLINHHFHVGLSLDGNAHRHNLLRRMANGDESHEKCALALQYFKDFPKQCVVILVIDPRNANGLTESITWLVDQGMRRFILNPNYYTTWNTTALETWQQELANLGEFYVRCFQSNHAIEIDMFDSKIESRIKGISSRCQECGYGVGEIAIAPSGAIYPCVRSVGDDHDSEMRLGNVFDGFDHARRSQILASRHVTHDECTTCEAKERCENWCACINRGTTGDINRVSGLVCHHEKTVIATADRAASEMFAMRIPAFMERFYGA